MRVQIIKAILWGLAVTTLLLGCGESEDPQVDNVARIVAVHLDVLDTNPQSLRIRVKAQVNTAGWSNPHLIQYQYLVPPQDGIYDFDFVATPPRENSAQVISYLEAEFFLQSISQEFQGVRIHSDINSVEKTLPQNVAPTAYFEFRGSDELDRFVIRLVEADKIQHARDLLTGAAQDQPSVMGLIVKSPLAYNPDWSYHLESESITFFDLAIEVCDGNMRYIEDNLDEVGGALLPGNQWCPWSSQLTREVFLE